MAMRVLVGELMRLERLEWGFGRNFEGANWCWDNIEFKVGEGTKVNFWTDQWCGNEACPKLFPSICLGGPKERSVNEMWDSSLGQGGWNIRFSRF
ncbi:hypothetical protein CK203_051791 [Vitis vinifera]|uniref:Reverse transcriptase zinc-binding domain-containing protein n=1 Tax=Vitis vinifera TaxID=29760 RepID=A0A438GUP9_VITVI|nr:hypothetical protein CK203_051791 [Vitis vinifera]